MWKYFGTGFWGKGKFGTGFWVPRTQFRYFPFPSPRTQFRNFMQSKNPAFTQSFLSAAESRGVEPHTLLRVPIKCQLMTLPQAFYSPLAATKKLYHKQWERANKNTSTNEDVFIGSLNENEVPLTDTYQLQYTSL